jgi:hypothetical protein
MRQIAQCGAIVGASGNLSGARPLRVARAGGSLRGGCSRRSDTVAGGMQGANPATRHVP